MVDWYHHCSDALHLPGHPECGHGAEEACVKNELRIQDISLWNDAEPSSPDPKHHIDQPDPQVNPGISVAGVAACSRVQRDFGGQ